VARQLERKQVEFLLPTYTRMTRWSDRLKRVLAPLFPNYIFVRVTSEERLQVLQTAGVVNVVSVAGKPAVLRDDEITMLRECMAHPNAVEPHPFLKVGQRVRVKHGPFAGWKGVLTRKNNAARLVVSVEHLMRSVAVNLDDAEVEALS
jgi:transcription antitermination factor NusG